MTEATKHGARVRAAILSAGLRLWREEGQQAASLRRIARECGITHGNVRYHCQGVPLVDMLAAEAVRIGESRVIVALISIRHKSVAGLSADDRARHLVAAG